MNADVHPEAEEVCDGADNDCDGSTDECESNADASCTDVGDGKSECRLSVGDSCEDASMCPDGTNCDPNSGQCRRVTGESCESGECLEALTCSDGTCHGDFCAQTTCPRNKPRCDDMRSRCVECRYWSDSLDANCEPMEACVGRGWCGFRTKLSSAASVDGLTNVTEAILKLSIQLADCWNDKYEGGQAMDMCAAVELGPNLSKITEQDVRDAYSAFKEAYNDDELDHMTDEQYNQLGKLLGDGWTDLNNLAWKQDIQRGIEQTCIWFNNHGNFGRAKLHVQQCADFDLPDN
ncbi:MAG: putative metal-binding motif-containing protein, partial [Bradymonadaceae bacterium]